MDILKISDLEKAFKIETQDPFQRVADTIRIALKFFPELKNKFFSTDEHVKKQSIASIRFVINKIDSERIGNSKLGIVCKLYH